MHRLSALFLCLLLVLSLGIGSAAHATEGPTCVETVGASSIGHGEGDADQVPADADKAYPHHHGGCHGHHVGVPIGAEVVTFLNGTRLPPRAWREASWAPVKAGPALRPPQA